ncbi:Mg-protoporphyrin IX methyl transferase [Caloramator mitchellensis]|uniref:Mg-protoporphyrin IX methyl transferase n=1 Tax=Caloramator mitchellensis TaxID=908809 RepID=A0A0R3JY63_CALMK|nr:methyltransferase domain-containing protein [Caloramator mitchellensis]KRQ88010.1 Mg-protoporphyrin IX methyl transferase [Caloramator mitchellensis]
MMFFYYVNFPDGEKELCLMELRRLFNINLDGKYFFYDEYIDVNRSPYIKYCIKIDAISESIEDLADIIEKKKIKYDDYKVQYISLIERMDLNKKHKIESLIGRNIEGEVKIHNPKTKVGVLDIEQKWVAGELIKNSGKWHEHDEKPVQYCNSLTARVSRALVNIATGRNQNIKMVDPCCGIGTVVLEALSMGIDIKGYDINNNVVKGAKNNLKYFGYPDVVSCSDIKDIAEKFDAAIVDLPYGVLSVTTREIQDEIIKNTARIAKRAVFVTLEDMQENIKNVGFEITDECRLRKGKFIRYINLCEIS